MSVTHIGVFAKCLEKGGESETVEQCARDMQVMVEMKPVRI